MKRLAKKIKSGGFTLLEVMVAIAILAMSMTALFSSQIQNVGMGVHAKWTVMASLMARCKMSEIELELKKNGFPEADEIETDRDCCEIYASEEIKCDWEITRVELPSSIDVETAISNAMTKESLANFIGEFQAERIEKQLSAMGGMGVLSALIPMINDLLIGTIRRIDLRVKWKERGKEKKLEITQFITNPSQGSMGPLLQMGVIQDLIKGVRPQKPVTFDQIAPILRGESQ